MYIISLLYGTLRTKLFTWILLLDLTWLWVRTYSKLEIPYKALDKVRYS